MKMKMKKFLTFLCLVFLIFGVVASAGATVLTFDDVSATAQDAYIPDGYGGLNWGNMALIHQDMHPVSGYNNGTVSGDYTAFNPYSRVEIVSDGFFDFNGAYLTGAWNNGLNIEVTGLFGGTELYNTTVVVDADGPTWFDFNYKGIDELVFRSFGGDPAGYSLRGTHFAMDDFTFTATPEPATVFLLGSGLTGLAAFGRKRKFFKK